MKKKILILMLTVFVMGLFAIGGDDFSSALQIQYMPYNDTGDTSTLTNVIGNTSADAFYLINSTIELTNLSIDLTGSSFDTYLRVYAGDMTTQLWADDDGGSGTTSMLSGLTLAPATDYYICVEGYSSNVGAYTMAIIADQVGSITNAAAPGVIVNALPVNGAMNQTTTTTISWDFGANTETYDLYFDTVNPPIAMVVNNAVSGVSGGYDPGALTETTTYYWKVVSRNSATRFETTNPVYSFSTVAGDITTYPYTQQFDVWPAVGYATSGTNNWASYTLAGTPAPSIFCNFWGWSTGNAAFETVPFDATGITPALSFDWSHQYNASYPNDALEVSISTDGGASWTQIWYLTGSAFESNDGAGSTTPGTFITEVVSLGAYANTTFSLKFDGISGYGPDLYLDNLSIVDNSTPPAVTTLVAPADGAIDQLSIDNLEWNSVNFADGYDLYFGIDNPPTSILNGADQGSALTYAYSGLTGGITYYWQVVPYNVNGDAVAAPVWSFTTAATPPGPVALIAPADAAIDQYFDVSLSWATSSVADGYYLNFGTDNPPTNELNMHDNGIMTSADVTDLAGDTSYYWQVIPYNANGNAAACPVWSFTTSANAPSEIGMISPADMATEVNEYTTFIWDADIWAYGYNLYIGTDGMNYTMTDVGNVTGVTLTTPLNYNTMYYWYVTAYNPNGEGAAPIAIRTYTTQSNPNFGGDGTLYGGYYFANSTAGGNGLGYQPTFNWIDISATGTTPSYDDADDGYADALIGFTFNYFGVDYTEIYLGTNGYCMFSNPTGSTASSMSIPDLGTPNDVIALSGMDLHTLEVPSVPYYGNDADGNFVYTVEMWNDYSDDNEYMDMQLILYTDGRIKIQYRNYFNGDVEATTSTIQGDACIGIENADGTIGHQYRNNGVGGPMLDDMALCYAMTAEGLAEPSNGLEAPTNLVLTYAMGLMNLSWDAVNGATLYNVYAGVTPDFVVGPTSFLSTWATNSAVMDPALLPGNHYFVKVTADDVVVRTNSFEPVRRSYRTYGWVEYIEPTPVIEKAKK